MTAVTNFLKNNMLFWLLPLLLLVAKMVFDLIPYKPLFFSLTLVIMGITAFVIQKSRLDISITATRELLEFEFEDEDDVSKYGAKSAEDKKRKVCDDLSKSIGELFLLIPPLITLLKLMLLLQIFYAHQHLSWERINQSMIGKFRSWNRYGEKLRL